MLREGVEALFFARSDHEGCANALAETLSDVEATRRRVTRARARAEDRSWDWYLRATDDFVEGAAEALGVARSQSARPQND
jgi:hypothetical protein